MDTNSIDVAVQSTLLSTVTPHIANSDGQYQLVTATDNGDSYLNGFNTAVGYDHCLWVLVIVLHFSKSQPDALKLLIRMM